MVNSDENLVKRCKNDDDDAMVILISRYLKIIKAKTAKYKVFGFEYDDFVQEGTLGLMSAIKTFSDDKNCSFNTYANICIDNRMKNMVRLAKSKKYSLLASCLPVDDVLELSNSTSIEDMFAKSELMQILNKNVKLVLSAFERRVLFLYLNGYSYKRIAQELKGTQKSVDNALQRVTKKLKNIIT